MSPSSSTFGTTITPEEWKAMRRASHVTSVLDDCIAAGMPMRYASVKPDTYRASSIASSGRGLYICGSVGAGKTHAACRILIGWVAGRHGTARMVSSLAMLSAIRDSYGSGESELQVVASFSHPDLLIVDDLGKERPTEWALSKLFEIFDARWGSMLPTVITTQDGPSALAHHLAAGGDTGAAQAIVSRIMGTSEVVRLTGQDRRVPKSTSKSAK